MEIRLASNLQSDSIVDGEGLRVVLWTQGCPHHCPGCHNAHTWNEDGGFTCDVEDIKSKLSELTYHDGLTLSGGEPLFQPKQVLEIAKHAKSLGLNIWCWTGYLYEDVIRMSKVMPVYKELLENIDILVDGKFEYNLKSFDYAYRGSSNQRIIDVSKSLKEDRTVAITKYDNNISNRMLYEKPEFVFI